MIWGGWDAFWVMGGYGQYVWASYAVTLLTIVTELVLLRGRRKRILAQLETRNTEYTGSER